MADQAFSQASASDIAKIGVLVGSVLAAALGSVILGWSRRSNAMSPLATESAVAVATPSP